MCASPTNEGAETGLSDADVHDILRNERRRRTLEYLFDADLPVTVSELTGAVAAQEAGEDPPPEDTERSVYVSLYQNHLPKLENAGVVERDDEDRVVLTDRADRLATFLWVDDRLALLPRFAALYGLAVAVGLAGTGLSAAGVPPGDALSQTAWAVAGLVAVACLVVAQYALYRAAGAGP